MKLDEYMALVKKEEQESDGRLILLYEEQQRIQKLRNELEKREHDFAVALADIGNYQDPHYKITDMREIRVLNMDLLKQNFPDVWDMAKPNDKYILARIREYLGGNESELLDIVRNMNPEQYDAERSLTLAEFDKAVGDSSAKKKFTGTAYNLKWTPTKKTHIERIGVSPMQMVIEESRVNRRIEELVQEHE